MTTNIVDILGVDVRSASVLARDCSFPIVDWVRRCPGDEVLANLPIRLGAWEDGTIAPAIDNYTREIDFGTITPDGCNLPTLRTSISSCELIAPNMAEIGVMTPDINWKDTRTQFCRQRRILADQLCVFDSNGELDPGSEFVIDFIRFAMNEQNSYMVDQTGRSALVGDEANENEFDGLYNQLENGWPAPQDEPCDQELNVATVIEWDVLTDNAGNPTPPDAVTVDNGNNNLDIDLWGTTYTIPEGLNLAQLFEDVLIDAVELNWADSRGGVDMWELHMPWGLKKCMLNVAACMQPCKTCGADNTDINFEDPGLRERFINMLNGDMIELLPSMRAVKPLQSRFVDDNTMWLGPGSIGGRPSYVLFMDDITRYLAAFGDLANDGFGLHDMADNDMSDFFTPQTSDNLMSVGQLQGELEARAFYWYIKQETIKCLTVSMLACAGLLACNRHLWYKITGVDCCGVVEECDSHLVDITNGQPGTPIQP